MYYARSKFTYARCYKIYIGIYMYHVRDAVLNLVASMRDGMLKLHSYIRDVMLNLHSHIRDVTLSYIHT